MDDAGGGGDDAEVVEGLLAPLEELVALAVALELLLGVDGQRGAEAKASTWTEWSMTRSQGTRGLTGGVGFVAGHADDAGPHGGEVDHGGHAGEVLEHDAAGLEGDLGVADVPVAS